MYFTPTLKEKMSKSEIPILRMQIKKLHRPIIPWITADGLSNSEKWHYWDKEKRHTAQYQNVQGKTNQKQKGQILYDLTI